MAVADNLSERRAVLEQLYRDFNARDIDAVMEHLAPDVDWPNAATGERLHGRAAVRAYWLAQWKDTDPRVEPMKIDETNDGGVQVLVDQLVRARDGAIISNKQVLHVYRFDGAFIAAMNIVDFDRDENDDDDDDDEE
jgi:ketosteroid isomerase-like protein